MNSIKIVVDAYNREQRILLYRHYPKAYRKIYPFLNTTKDYSFEDFKTYSVFRHQQECKDFRKFEELSKQPFKWQTESQYFDFINGSLRSKSGLKPVNDVPESLGVAGSLTVASAIFGLTQADWKSIPVPKKGEGRDFDFKIAATSSHFVVVESKGSVVEDNSLPSSVSSHKLSIKNKKDDQRFVEKYDGDVCFGLITVADTKHDLKVYITDPEMPEIQWAPKKVKLVKRLTFYYNLLRTISPRSFITITLGNRIKTLQITDDFERFDGVPLLGINEKPIEISDGFYFGRSHEIDGSKVGKIFINQEDLFFVGVEKSILDSISNMSFEEILNYKVSPITSESYFGLVAKKNSEISRRLISTNLHYSNKVISREYATYVRNSAGLIYSKI